MIEICFPAVVWVPSHGSMPFTLTRNNAVILYTSTYVFLYVNVCRSRGRELITFFVVRIGGGLYMSSKAENQEGGVTKYYWSIHQLVSKCTSTLLHRTYIVHLRVHTW